MARLLAADPARGLAIDMATRVLLWRRIVATGKSTEARSRSQSKPS
jgi:hypothetical protein